MVTAALACFAALSGFTPAALSEEDGKGIAFASITYRDQPFDVVRIDLKKADLRLFWNNAEGTRYGSFGNLREALAADGYSLRFATNAGIFTPEFAPAGLHVENGEVLHELNTRNQGYGNFHLMPNGVFYVDDSGAHAVPTDVFQASKPSPRIATQSGPMLVIDGKLHDAFTEGSDNKRRRSGVGVVSDHEVVFAASNLPVNFFDFASLFKEALHCDNALFLDGDISLLYAPDMGKAFEGGRYAGMFAVVEKETPEADAPTPTEGNQP